MKKINLFYLLKNLLIFSLLLLCNCNKEEDYTNKQNTKAFVTEVGTPVGSESFVSVGASGGTIISPDGLLTVTIPSQALESETKISIQPLSNEAPLGLGSGYRLQPEGTKFSKPIQLVFHYSDALLDGTAADFLWIVTQAADGSWNALLKSVVDKYAKTVTVETTHFSDWALGKFIDFTLNPSSKTIKKGESVQLQLSGFSKDKALDDNDELAPLVPITGDGNGLTPLTTIPPIESRLMDFKVKQWTMNGAAAPVSNNNGSLSASGTNATYTAPNKRPDTNPVAVTVQLEGNNKEGAKATYMVTSSISVVETGYYLFLKVDGVPYEYYQYGFNGAIPPDPNNLSMANCGVDGGILTLVGTTVTNGSDLKDGFALEFKNPSETTRRLSGYNEDGPDDMAFTLGYSGYSIDYEKRTFNAATQICDWESKCGDIYVTISTYSTSDKEVWGNFSGKLYEVKETNSEQCKTDIEHTVQGMFRLVISNLYFK